MKYVFICILLFLTFSTGFSERPITMNISYKIEPYKVQPYTIPPQYLFIVIKSARENGIPIWILARLLERESCFNPDTKSYNYNKKGKIDSIDEGIGQQCNKWHKDFVWFDNNNKEFDPFNAYEAIPVTAHYLGRLYKATGNMIMAVAAYNCGLGKVLSGKIPEKTRQHLKFIFGV